jgi:putative acetyltransferase
LRRHPVRVTGLVVRPEAPADHERVQEVHEAAFGRPDEARLVEALRRSERPTLSLVAEWAGRVEGHVFLSPVAIEGAADAPPAAGLAPLGVAPAVQGRGVGGALMRAALSRAPSLGWRAVFLLGDPGYYARFGFVLAAPRGFHYESPAFDSAFQMRELAPAALSGLGGFVRYADAFASV